MEWKSVIIKKCLKGFKNAWNYSFKVFSLWLVFVGKEALSALSYSTDYTYSMKN